MRRIRKRKPSNAETEWAVSLIPTMSRQYTVNDSHVFTQASEGLGKGYRLEVLDAAGTIVALGQILRGTAGMFDEDGTFFSPPQVARLICGARRIVVLGE